MRQPFFEFPTGWASVGLLLFRLVASAGLIWDALPYARGGLLRADSVFHFLSALLGLFLAVGYRTHLIGAVTAAIEIWLAVFSSGDPLAPILLAAFAAGLSLLGPGVCSIDARAAGWKRIEIPKRKP